MKCCITVNCYPFLQVGGGCFDSFWELDGEMFYCQSEAAPSDRGLTLFGKRAKLSPALAGTTARLPVTEGSSFGQHLTADGVLLLQPFTPIPHLASNSTEKPEGTPWQICFPHFEAHWSVMDGTRGLQTQKIPQIQHLKNLISSVSDLREPDGWVHL